MSEETIRQGQIYKVGNSKLVVTLVECDTETMFIDELHIINDKGCTNDNCDWNIEFIIEKGTLIAEYPTWQEAVNSKEFNQ